MPNWCLWSLFTPISVQSRESFLIKESPILWNQVKLGRSLIKTNGEMGEEEEVNKMKEMKEGHRKRGRRSRWLQCLPSPRAFLNIFSGPPSPPENRNKNSSYPSNMHKGKKDGRANPNSQYGDFGAKPEGK